MRKLLFFVTLIFMTCFTTFAFAQSRIPQETYNWLQVTGQPGLGSLDSVMVAFFEVPDTETSTLYFAIRHPHLTNTSPDWYATTGNTIYTLIGGSGTLTDAKSRQLQYDAGELSGNDHLTGTTLDTLVYNITAPGTTWVYFSGVNPSQGEYIGNKYYFKIVVEATNGIDLKNAFQLDISTVSSGNPTGLAGVSTFAYSWNIALLGVSNIFNSFPFVPEGDVGDYVVFTNFDFDWDGTTNPSGVAYNKSNALSEASSLGAISPSLQGVPYYNTSYQITSGEDNGTWKAKYDEGTDIWINTSEFWAWNNSTAINDQIFYDVVPYRTYSSYYVPSPPNRVSTSYIDGQAIDDGIDTETINMQIVDSAGSPVLYVRDVYVSLTGSAQITSASNTSTGLPASAALITTDIDGLAWFTISNNTTEVVYINVYTNGTNGSDTLPGTNNQIYVNFHPVGIGPLDHILITDALNGTEVTTYTMTTDDSYTVYASGYDALSNFIDLVSVDWDKTGTLDAISGSSTSYTFSPSTAPTSGIITVDDGATHTDTTGTLTVNPGALDHFVITTISDPQELAVAFNITITAQDTVNNTVMGFTGTVDLTGPTGMVPAITAAFVTGARTESITISNIQSGVAITATNSAGAENGISNTFDVTDTTAPAAPTVTSTTPIDDFTPTWIWNTPATTVEFRYSLVDGGPWSITVATNYTSAALPYGTYTLYVQARDSLNNWSTSGNFTVEIAPIPDHFAFMVQPIDAIANTPIIIKIEARDAVDALKAAFNNAVTLTDSTGSITPASITFTNGVFDGTVTIPDIQNDVTITVTYGTATGTSNTFKSYFPKYNIRNNVINPRNGDLVEIYFETTKNQKVTAKVYDLAGDLVKTLIDKSYSAGGHSFTWDGKSKRNKPCVKGLYFIVVRIGKSRKVYKVLIVN